MDLDRSSIEKRDFPVKRRGYDPDSVAAHLATLAGEIEALQRTPQAPRSEGLAATASDQVRSIVEAAERSAADLERQAVSARDGILAHARLEAHEHLERVERATASMLERADQLEAEFETMLEQVRAGAARLNEGLKVIEGTVEHLRGGEDREPVPVDDLSAPVAPPAPDDEGARLIALNMALSGTPREEAERFLTDRFDTLDLDGLLDDVYVRAGL